ncbi:hypothetical protein ACIBQX_10400 [Nonomuraea sp. NPDC049714]|uniref:hypothetical protein n=1 Tax=Nonomuraea sp. NPDC049714 TaxID=3364357 RepID=UPI0037BB1A4E
MTARSWKEVLPLDDIVEQVANYSAIPLALLGFSFTLWQLLKTRRAAEAARDAARAAQQSIARNSLLMLIPQLQRIEEELDRAVHVSSLELTMAWLTSWRWQAGQVRGYLSVVSVTDKKVMKVLQSSVMKASVAKTDLIDGAEGLDLVLATKTAREAIAAVTNELGVLAAMQGAQAEEGQ